MTSRHATKYDRIGQTYYDTAAVTRQEFESAMQRARKELRGLEERRKAREGKQEDTMRVDKQEKAARPKATVARLFGRAGKATPTVKAIRGAS